MDQEEIDKLQRELAEYKGKASEKNDKVLSLLTQGKAIGLKPVTFLFGDIEVKTQSYIPKDLRKKFVESYKKYNDNDSIDISAYDDIIDMFAEFMATICIDEEFKDKSVWIKFDEECGLLSKIVSIIFQELNVNDTDIVNFRKK